MADLSRPAKPLACPSSATSTVTRAQPGAIAPLSPQEAADSSGCNDRGDRPTDVSLILNVIEAASGAAAGHASTPACGRPPRRQPGEQALSRGNRSQTAMSGS